MVGKVGRVPDNTPSLLLHTFSFCIEKAGKDQAGPGGIIIRMVLLGEGGTGSGDVEYAVPRLDQSKLGQTLLRG